MKAEYEQKGKESLADGGAEAEELQKDEEKAKKELEEAEEAKRIAKEK